MILIDRTLAHDPQRASKADELMRQAIHLLEENENDDSNTEAA